MPNTVNIVNSKCWHGGWLSSSLFGVNCTQHSSSSSLHNLISHLKVVALLCQIPMISISILQQLSLIHTFKSLQQSKRAPYSHCFFFFFSLHIPPRPYLPFESCFPSLIFFFYGSSCMHEGSSFFFEKRWIWPYSHLVVVVDT